MVEPAFEVVKGVVVSWEASKVKEKPSKIVLNVGRGRLTVSSFERLDLDALKISEGDFVAVKVVKKGNFLNIAQVKDAIVREEKVLLPPPGERGFYENYQVRVMNECVADARKTLHLDKGAVALAFFALRCSPRYYWELGEGRR